MTYVQTSVVSEDIVRKVMEIEKEVYEPEYRGTFESIMSRYRACPQMFILACDEDRDNELAGYLCWLPLSREVFDKIVDDGELHDDDIRAEELDDALKAGHILLLSVAVKKPYRREGIGAALICRFEDWMRGGGNPARIVRHVAGCAVTEGGDGICRRCNYRRIHNLRNPRGYSVYAKDIKPAPDAGEGQ